ncbi:MAG: phosphatase PAP2 family protein [Bacteroidetes bacterium]|nr:MAG: phosphatase PAP2 family protein [Bacteroidota bacterium]
MSSTRTITTLAVALCSMATASQAQGPSSSPPAHTAPHSSYWASYWHHGIALAKSPLHWNTDHWVAAGSTLAITGIIVTMDEAVSQPFFNLTSPAGQQLGRMGNQVGGLPVQFGISGLALGIGTIAKNRPLQNFALDNFQAQAFTGGLTFAVKQLTRRARPLAGQGAYVWNGPFKGNSKSESFFSGHTSLAFSTATMVYLHSKRQWWVALLAYGSATAVGLSRMQQQKHWASDVVVGAVIGATVSAFVYKQQQKRRAAKASPRPFVH